MSDQTPHEIIGNPLDLQTVEDEYLEAMPSIIRCTPAQKRDGYGKRTAGGDPVKSPAYLQTTHEQFATEDGDINVANGRAFLGYIIPWLTVDDTFEVQDLEGNWGPVSMVAVETVYGPGGPHHLEVWYGGRGSVRGRN